MRLLLLEDDPTLGSGLVDFLVADGHAVDWCERVAQARALRGERYDALLVDWQLPDGSGLDWVRSLRHAGEAAPILVLTARDRVSDRIAGLDTGADDYLVKPFDPEEMVARIRAVRRRAAGSPDARLQFGPVAIDLSARCALRDGERVELTAREWGVTEALALRAGRLVAKGELESLVLGLDGDLASNALEVHVCSIRRKLGRSLIETVRGMGYRMNA